MDAARDVATIAGASVHRCSVPGDRLNRPRASFPAELLARLCGKHLLLKDSIGSNLRSTPVEVRQWKSNGSVNEPITAATRCTHSVPRYFDDNDPGRGLYFAIWRLLLQKRYRQCVALALNYIATASTVSNIESTTGLYPDLYFVSGASRFEVSESESKFEVRRRQTSKTTKSRIEIESQVRGPKGGGVWSASRVESQGQSLEFERQS